MAALRALFFALVFLGAHVTCAAAAAPIFWEQEIAAALQARQLFYRQLGLNGSPERIIDRDAADALAARLPERADEQNPWYHFVRGVTLTKNDSRTAAAEFTFALSGAQAFPGTLWVLFVEFRRLGYDAWANAALQNLEKCFLTCGAQSAPVIAQQLLFFASQEIKRGSPARAQNYLLYARRFEGRHMVSSLLLAIITAFPLSPSQWFPALTELFYQETHSWTLQIALTQMLWQWFFYCVAVMFIAVLAVLSYKYLPVALHSASERFPRVLRAELRLMLAIVCVSALAFFSLYAVAWLLVVLMVSVVARRDRMLLIGVAVCLCLAPLWYVGDAVLHVPAENTGIAIFQKVTGEGWYPALQNRLDELRTKNPGDYLVQTSSALMAIKHDDYPAAQKYANAALALQPDDPVVLLTMGNVLFYRGKLERAFAYYTQCLQRFPRCEEALFNSGQYFCNTMESIKGTDFFAHAARLNRPLVTGFITVNDLYFPNRWPPLRQLMQPDFPAGHVWGKLLFSSGAIGASADARWGLNLLGLPLSGAFPVAAFMLFLVLYLDIRQHTVKRPGKISRCALCGIPICHTCRQGILCRRCFDYTRHIRSEKLRTQKEIRITLKKDRLQRLLRAVFNVAFPGSGGLLAERPARLGSILLLTLTALLYATVLLCFSQEPALGFAWMPRAAVAALIPYNGLFLALSLSALRRKAQEV